MYHVYTVVYYRKKQLSRLLNTPSICDLSGVTYVRQYYVHIAL